MSLPRLRTLSPRPAPRGGPSLIEPSIVLGPALRRLSAIGEDLEAVAEVIDGLPPHLLVLIIDHAIGRRVLKWGTIRALIVAAGVERMVERFGREQAVALFKRYLESARRTS